MTSFNQYDLFSAIAIAYNQADIGGEELANQGIEAALEATGDEWRERALREIKHLFLSKKRVTADDMEGNGDPAHQNAMGGIFKPPPGDGVNSEGNTSLQ
jgi:hypothetical protein